MILNTNFIDEFGDIQQLVYKVNHNIISDVQLKIFKEDILTPINNSVLVLRGISDFEQKLKLTKKKLHTNKLKIEYKSGGYDHIILNEPSFGSPAECLKRNLELMAQIECAKVQSYFEHIRVNLVELDKKSDSIYLPLTEIKSNGIITNLYEIKFKFRSDWSATCSTCVNGMLHLKNEMEKMSKHLYSLPSETIEIDGYVISDLNINNSDLLKGQINILLANALYEAKVEDFEIIPVKEL